MNAPMAGRSWLSMHSMAAHTRQTRQGSRPILPAPARRVSWQVRGWSGEAGAGGASTE